MSPAYSSGHRILIADDARTTAMVMAGLLSSRGHEVLIASDGEECLALVEKQAPELLVLDLVMPKIHGIEVLRRLRANPKTAGIPVIMCTARNYKTDHDQARELGVVAVLGKPFESQRFLDLVEECFGGAAQGNEVPRPRGDGSVYKPTIPADRCYYRLWGTRGSIPVAGPPYVRHGGNTSCVEVGCGEDYIIVDAGSGIRPLGMQLAQRRPRRVHILITHTHWDHIQGFPFFTPAYLGDFELIIYGATGFRKDLASIFRGQLDRDYFPVQFEDMRARIDFRPLEGEMLQIGPFAIRWEFTHHPAATVGFTFEAGGRKLAYVSDNEFLYGYLGAPENVGLESEILIPHRRLLEFVRNADVLVAEAQYTNEEYVGKVGWGHSSLSNACALAKLSEARRWVVTHHDHSHADDFLDQKLNLTKEILRGLNHPIMVSHGYDDMVEYW